MTENIQRTLLRTCNAKLTDITDRFEDLTPKDLREKMDRLKEWFKNQPHLPNNELDDEYLIRHSSMLKFNEEKTKKAIEAIYTSRTLLPEFYADREIHMTKALEYQDLIVMPQRTEKNYRVSVMKFNIDNKEIYDLDKACFSCMMLGDIRLYSDTSSGDLMIWDFENLTFNQFKQFNLATFKKSLFVLQSCYGVPVKGIHVINAPAAAEITINVAKATMKKKVSERLFIHSNAEALHKVFPMKYLPKDMGGEEPLTLKEISSQWKKAIDTPEMRQWFKELDSQKSDESKRLGKKDFLVDDMVGMRGTFRKLDLD